jgi:hypothetical protein
MWVELNTTEQSLAKLLAKSRYEANRNSGVWNARIGPQSDETTDLEGIGAELAFCRIANVYPDLTIDSHPEEDALTHCGRRVDVKGTRYERGHLLAVLGKAGKAADIYVLVVGTFPRYRIAGMAYAEEVFKDENIKDFGYGPTYAVPQRNLHRFN